MKKSISLLVLFLLPFLTAKTPGQNKFSVEINGGRTQNFPGENELSYWPDGWTAGIGLKYALTPSLEIGINGSYNTLELDKDKVFYAFPDVCCNRYNVTGNNTKVYEATISVQFNTVPDFFIKPYFTLKSGLYFINTSEIYFNNYIFNSLGKANTTQSTLGISGKNFTKSFAGAGFGLAINLAKNLELRTQVLVNITFDGSGAYWPITSGINFGL